jgi:alpha-L-rhamnosidase
MNYPTNKFLVYLFVVAISTLNAAGQTISNLTLQSNQLMGANWIGDAKVQPTIDSLMYEDDPAPLFRKLFTVTKKLKSAVLYITAAGYYNASLNGNKIGKNFLDPAWTSYAKRIYYASYNITSNILPGLNCIGVSLGNGFYNPLPLRMWGNLNLREKLSVGRPKLIAKLVLTYADGKIDSIKTDGTWRVTDGPIIRNNVYLGEVYDARKEIKNWDKASFNDASWSSAIICDGPGGQLQKSFFPAIQKTENIEPLSISSPKKDVWVIDMGKNFTGLYKIKLQGKPGDKINLRFGERIYKDGQLNPMTSVCGQIKSKGVGGKGAPTIAWQTDQYIFGQDSAIWYTPTFTFHLCRYIEITGLAKAPSKKDIIGLMLHTNVTDAGSFSSSSTLLNDIQKAAKLTFVDNLMSVQSDCPARERFGYGGDLNATSEAFIYNYNMHDFYKKTVYDWVDAVNDSSFIDVAPYTLKYCGISWESAVITTQEHLLNYYNDTAIVRALYQFDINWMEKAARINPEGITHDGLADHESLVTVPVELIGTSHYLKCARIMKRFAQIMNDETHAIAFEKLAQTLSNSITNLFWKNKYQAPINRQTQFATLLYYNLIPANEKQAAVDSLLNSVKDGINEHFTTGIFGTKYILEALSEAGHVEDVYKIVSSKVFPGWGFMIDKGATTLWETWKESENTFSNCHPMFGTVTEWFYRWLGGIRAIPNYAGFSKFIIAPYLPADLLHVNCSYQSPNGLIRSNWIKKSKNIYQFNFTVPANSEAFITLPFKYFSKISITHFKNNKTATTNLNKLNFNLQQGNYQITVNTLN